MNVDYAALRFNQAAIVSLVVVAFLLDARGLVAAVAAVMLVGTIWPQAGLFKLVYTRLIAPQGWLRPDLRKDDLRPHLFAQGLGGLFLLASAGLLWGALPVAGWTLAWLVVALAAVNLFLGFCAGCFLFYQLGRLGVTPVLPSWPAAVKTKQS